MTRLYLSLIISALVLGACSARHASVDATELARYHVPAVTKTAKPSRSAYKETETAPRLRTSIRVPSSYEPDPQQEGQVSSSDFDTKELYFIYSGARGLARLRMPLPSAGEQGAREALGRHLDALYLVFKSDPKAVARIEARASNPELAKCSAESMSELLQSACVLEPERLLTRGAAANPDNPEGLTITLINPHLNAMSDLLGQADAPARPALGASLTNGSQASSSNIVTAGTGTPLDVPLPVEGGRTLYFDTGSSDVEKQFREDIRQIAERMLGNPNLVVTLEGHSDNVGNADDNKRLSYHRAMSIQIALLDKYGIVASRIKVSGYGEERPAASNSSREGRRLNRRVEVNYTRTQVPVLAAPNLPAREIPVDRRTTPLAPAPAEEKTVVREIVAPQAPQQAAAPEFRNEVATVPLAEQVSYARLPHAQPEKYRIEISVSKCTLWLYAIYSDGSTRLVRPYKVATAKKGVPYPTGLGHVTGIDFDPWWYPTQNMKRRAKQIGKRLVPVRPGSRANPMGAFKIILSHGNNGGAFRIHGTNKPWQIGKRVSLGCIRMQNEEGLELAKTIDVGTEVVVSY